MEMRKVPVYDEESVRARQSNPNDELERRIVGELEKDMLSISWARDLFSGNIRPRIISYLKDSFDHLNDPERIHDQTQHLLSDLAEATNATIVEGQENLDEVRGQSVFVATNHLGTYKLVSLDPSGDLDKPEIGLEDLDPFPAFYFSMYPVAKYIGDNLYEAAHDYPEPIRTVQIAAGSLIMPPGQTGVLDELEEDTKALFESRSNLALTLFPEGGTTGKRNNGGIYAMEKFRTGSFVIAGHLGRPVVPVSQYFDPNEGFKLRVFPALRLTTPPGDEEARSYFRQTADATQSQMQSWLNQQTSSTG